MKANLQKVRNILDAAVARGTEGASQIDQWQFHSGYAEPGYNDPESGLIVTGDYNRASRYDQEKREFVTVDDLPVRVARVLEKRYGAELEWEDEWVECSDCSKLVRTSPNSYGWMRSYVELDGEIVCRNCAKEHAGEILEGFENQPSKALTDALGIDPVQYGYVQMLEDLGNGLHEGQAADPKVIAQGLGNLGVKRFLFTIDSVGQFGITFSCWVHESELGGMDEMGCGNDDAKMLEIERIKTDADVSPAELCERALMGASKSARDAGEKPGDGYVLYQKVQPDGSMKSRWVSPEEFVKGIKE